MAHSARSLLTVGCAMVLGCLAATGGCAGRTAPEGRDGSVPGQDGPGYDLVQDGVSGDGTNGPCASLQGAACQQDPQCRLFACPGCNGGPGPVECVLRDANPICPTVACPDCRSLSSEAACLAMPGCVPRTCPACPGSGGGDMFIDCVPTSANDPPACICNPDDCGSFQDQASCEANGCTALLCNDCSGSQTFNSCYQTMGAPPPACPAIDCFDCTVLDEPSCWAEGACHADYCTGCTGNDAFAGCSPAGGPPTPCPQLDCAMPVCDGLDEAGCSAAQQCHPVYDYSGNYQRCASGTADCTSSAYCAVPVAACPQGYQALIRDGCYEGCATAPGECAAQ
jgi:hypothetical protein